MAEKLQQILDSLNWFVPKSLPWFCQIRENVSVHGLHTSNNWGSRFFCGFSGSQRHVTSKVSRDCSFSSFFASHLFEREQLFERSLPTWYCTGSTIPNKFSLISCTTTCQLPFILFWLPGPYFPYHLIINWPQPALDYLLMPGCFDLHSMLCSLIWSEKLFTLDPFPAVFPSLLSPFDKSQRPWKTVVGL